MRVLITGGCGFLGSNIATRLIEMEKDVYIFDNLARTGSDKNLERLKKCGRLHFEYGDIRNYNDVITSIKKNKPDVIYHLAGQVAMTTSIINPRLDFETNTVGTHNILEAVRNYSPDTIVVYASTNKVYGDLEELKYKETENRYIAIDFPNGFDESLQLNFHSPYGCSKGAADQYLLDYYRIYGINTIVLRHSSMYGVNQYATIDQGWIGWFTKKALEIKSCQPKEQFTVSGNGKQVRDVLFADDVVNCYLAVVHNIEKTKGQVFNIGGGMGNSISIIELFKLLENYYEIEIAYKKIQSRESDQKVFVSCNDKIMKMAGWKPNIDTKTGIKIYAEWIEKSLSRTW